MSSSFNVNATVRTFGGSLLKLSHESAVLGCKMALNVFLPSSTATKIPVLWHLAGLTCTGDNGAEKGFFNYWAAKHGIAMVYPDTSPRKILIAYTVFGILSDIQLCRWFEPSWRT